MEEPEYLTPDQVAEKLQMNPSVVRRMLASGKLPGKRVGRIWRVSASSLRDFINSGDKPAVPIVDGKPITEPLPPAASAKLAKKAATDPKWKNKTTGAKRAAKGK